MEVRKMMEPLVSSLDAKKRTMGIKTNRTLLAL